MLIKKHLDLMGHLVKDKVSDFKGVVISIAFDLYGCIQADVRPRELDKDGKLQQGFWMDVSRLEVLSNKPLMDQPDFLWGSGIDVKEEKKSVFEKVASGLKGPANLPQKL